MMKPHTGYVKAAPTELPNWGDQSMIGQLTRLLITQVGRDELAPFVGGDPPGGHVVHRGPSETLQHV